jgi:hypothetical protein
VSVNVVRMSRSNYQISEVSENGTRTWVELTMGLRLEAGGSSKDRREWHHMGHDAASWDLEN